MVSDSDASSRSPSDAGRSGSRTDALLRATGVRMGCAAVALLTATGSVRRIWARSASARQFAEAQVASLNAILVERVVDQRSRVLSNKVRLVREGPVVGRVLAVPVATHAQRPVGVLVAVQRAKDPAFGSSAVHAMRGLSETISSRMLRERDTATGLMTWSGFSRRVERLGTSVDPGSPIAVLYGNIDRLHLLNNARGMAAGDQVIMHAAHIIRRELAKSNGVACRISGDRFVVALPERDTSAARSFADQTRTAFEAEAQKIYGAGEALSMSWGVVARPAQALEVDQAVTDAELACRAAKDRGRNRVEAYEATDASMLQRHEDIDAVRLLSTALESDRILLYAQPIVPLLNTALPASYELLVRLETPSGRVVEPAEFMSAAARYQMLPELDRRVVARAFKQLRAAVGDAVRLPFNFSINLCGPTIGAPGFADWMIGQLREQRIPPDQLTIEITESAAASSLEALQRFIDRLNREGVRFAVDDFGTGVNSLSYLKSLNVSTIKLDGSYVRDVASDARSQALVRAIVQLADSMGILTIAEFVDSVALRTRLAEIGVQFAQGWAVGRPEPLAELLQAFAPVEDTPLAASSG
ncbi:MAG: EAL domain-containing protein [Steroidobacteraceae bacterium]